MFKSRFCQYRISILYNILNNATDEETSLQYIVQLVSWRRHNILSYCYLTVLSPFSENGISHRHNIVTTEMRITDKGIIPQVQEVMYTQITDRATKTNYYETVNTKKDSVTPTNKENVRRFGQSKNVYICRIGTSKSAFIIYTY